MSKMDAFEDFHPLTRQEWRAWLEVHHNKFSGIWFVYYKKATGEPRVTYDEAVEEALCFGWIDSLPRKFDEKRSKLLFTPRKLKSVWSNPNKLQIEKLIASRLMTEIGLTKSKRRKKTVRGTRDSSDNLEIPADLAKELKAEKEAGRNFEAFSDSVKRMILAWLGGAKWAETRNARIAKTVAMAKQNKRANFDKD